MMNHLDLCSGIGGWALAFRELGIKTIAFCEIEKYPQQVLKKNFPDIPIFNDLKELTYENIKERTGTTSINILTCSYPCQPFSVAGRQKGEEDPRHLWPDTFRLVKECQPSWFIGENVSGHIKLGLDTVLQDLASEGYDTRTFIIPASSVGAWHKRERLWIIGHKAVSDTKSEGLSGSRGQESNTNRTRVEQRKGQEQGTIRSKSKRCSGVSTDVSDTDNSRDRTSRHEADQEQPQTDQGWQEQPQSELSRHSKNVSDTESLRSGRRSGEECRTPEWQFFQKKQEGGKIRGEVEGCSTSSGENVPNPTSEGLQRHNELKTKQTRTSSRQTKNISNADIQGSQRWLPRWENQKRESELGHAGCSSSAHIQQGENWWQTQSELCGVPNGISVELDKNRVGRIKGLGNAIVPQIAWFIGNAILSAQNQK